MRTLVKGWLGLLVRIQSSMLFFLGGEGGTMVLGKPPVPWRPTNFDYSRAMAYCAYSRCGGGGGCLDIFIVVYPFLSLSPSLWETARYRLKYCLKEPLSPKATNQPFYFIFFFIYLFIYFLSLLFFFAKKCKELQKLVIILR